MADDKRNLCKDCTFFRFGPEDCWRGARHSLVTGERRELVGSASRERRGANWVDKLFGIDRCGPDAKYFRRWRFSPPSPPPVGR